jgi:DNA polymerase elongation subunit (family B)
MGHLFLDIETYSSRDEPDSSLNPYKNGAKVIVIAYNYYGSFRPPGKNEIKKPVFLLEWESSEKGILSQFHDFLRETKARDPHLKIIGFNITKFDLPYLFARMKLLEIAKEEELYELLFRPFGTDLMQLSAIISAKTRQHEQLWGTNHKEACRFFKLQEKEANGLECSRFYENKEYGKILEYCTQEFNFEQLLECFYLHVIEKNLK